MSRESTTAKQGVVAQVPVKKPKARRKYAPKVRTGCITWNQFRFRRKKCDEEKPFCRRCTEGGWKCDGYAPIAEESTSKNKKNSSAASIEPKVTPSKQSTALTLISGQNAGIPLLPRLPPTKNILEQHCLSHFFTYTLNEIDLAPGISGFWLKTLPALSQNEPLVRHAITALGATHWLFLSNNSSRINHQAQYQAVVTQQFTNAISRLVPLMSQAKPENTMLVLICCLLFVFIESLKGSQTEALRHLTAGCRLLTSLRDPPPELEGKLREIATVFRGLGSVVNMFNEDKIIPDLAPYAQLPKGYEDPTKPYESLDEAEQALAHLDLFLSDMHCAHDNSEGPFPERLKEINEETFQILGRRFRKWEARFEKTLETLRPPHSYEHLNLKLQRQLWAQMMKQPYGEEPIIDVEQCMSFMDQVEELLEMTNPTQRVFTAKADLIPVLVVVYGSCPVAKVRKRAIALLRLRSRREGFWDSGEAADFLQLDLDKCLAGQKGTGWPAVGPSTAQGALLVFRPKPET
ncbi:unnamed protein product [Clonostachys solani]|uniref:Zn(2)-C6 fungal-type domain-containing protein n=1 Tax=Clonostachys solani TaxID=160281 RepID=A0A9N9W8S5_9HYPO|nr:unnamed protein product [Clonostachys solani]